MGYGYVAIAAYVRINQGRVAEVMKARIGPDVLPADRLLPDFRAGLETEPGALMRQAFSCAEKNLCISIA
jgi:hypothetical protein